ncbi:MAG: hypothetical protein RIC55_34265 [Pirellulaceae bacterium]
MSYFTIPLLCMLAAVVYGVAQDQVTARICLEYFTIGHTPLTNTQSPTLLAFDIGIRASWWFGLLLGIPLALCSRLGDWPKLRARDHLVSIMGLFVAAAVIATLMGLVGRWAAASEWVWLVEPMASRVPRARHVDFLTDLWAHTAAYGVGAVGAMVICVRAVLRRRAAARASELQLEARS